MRSVQTTNLRYIFLYICIHIKIFRGTDIMLFWCHHMKISLFSLLDITALFIFFLPSSLPALHDGYVHRAHCRLLFSRICLVEEQYCKLWWQFLYACTHYLIEVSMKILIATYGDISSYIKEDSLNAFDFLMSFMSWDNFFGAAFNSCELD